MIFNASTCNNCQYTGRYWELLGYKQADQYITIQLLGFKNLFYHPWDGNGSELHETPFTDGYVYYIYVLCARTCKYRCTYVYMYLVNHPPSLFRVAQKNNVVSEKTR